MSLTWEDRKQRTIKFLREQEKPEYVKFQIPDRVGFYYKKKMADIRRFAFYNGWVAVHRVGNQVYWILTPFWFTYSEERFPNLPCEMTKQFHYDAYYLNHHFDDGPHE